MIDFKTELVLAEKTLKDAHTCIGKHMFEAASVQAKDAAVFAARALLLKHGGKIPKTQDELYSGFNGLVEEGVIQAEYGMMLKEILGSISVVPETKKTVKKAEVFISRVKDVLS